MEISRDQVVMPIIVATMTEKTILYSKWQRYWENSTIANSVRVIADGGERLKPMPNGSALLVRKYWIFSFSM